MDGVLRITGNGIFPLPAVASLADLTKLGRRLRPCYISIDIDKFWSWPVVLHSPP
jgi:hypothetical protein